MATLVVGTGFLGEALCDELHKRGEVVVSTYYSHQKYDDSIRYDFLHDDPKDMFAGENITTVIIPAKIEFTEDGVALGQAMERFLAYFSETRMVYISSDGIFDGTKGMYTESDTPHPTTLYGRNLALCEDLVKKNTQNYCIVRPSYMYGFVGGKLDTRLSEARTQLLEGKNVTRFTDMYKSPLSYRQAAESIVMLAFGEFVGTIHISGQRMSVYDFTREGMEALGVPTKNLHGASMPVPLPESMLADTSLDTSLMQTLIHYVPLSIQESLRYK